MSDGNFNRNLLPYNPFQSGLKIGATRMMTKAVDAFTTLVNEYCTEKTLEEREQMIRQFSKKLKEK